MYKSTLLYNACIGNKIEVLMAFSRYLDPKNDIAFKKIFGSEKNKDILIHFLNDILSSFKKTLL